jgi:hypothetical protein
MKTSLDVPLDYLHGRLALRVLAIGCGGARRPTRVWAVEEPASLSGSRQFCWAWLALGLTLTLALVPLWLLVLTLTLGRMPLGERPLAWHRCYGQLAIAPVSSLPTSAAFLAGCPVDVEAGAGCFVALK